MNLLQKALKIAHNDFLCLWSELRFKVCILLIFLFTHFILEEVNNFATSIGYDISIWLLPFIINQRFMRVILYSLFLFLVCETPFMNENKNQIFLLIRSGKPSFFTGKIFFLFLLSFLYTLCICFSSILCIIRRIDFTSDWGKVLGTLSLTDASADFDHSLQFSSNFILHESPIFVYIISFFLCVLSYFTLGMLIYVFNFFTQNQILGSLVGTILILLDFFLITDIVYEKFLYFSPLSWSNTSRIDLRENLTIYPSLEFAIIGYLVILLICILMISIRSKHYSID